jgi:diphosphomevalonate decarboxylase
VPMNSSISMTLRQCATVTTVAPDAALAQDTLVFADSAGEWDANTKPRALQWVNQSKFTPRATNFLDVVRKMAGRTEKSRVYTSNTFPSDGGIASSASGFAALALAASEAYGLKLNLAALSRLARRGSGSACRSIHGGFVEWEAGDSDMNSQAVQLKEMQHWPDLRDVIVVVSNEPKSVSSSIGHRLAATSPLYGGRIEYLPTTLARTREAIANRDLTLLGGVLEREALCLHAVIMTSVPSVLYWAADTLQIMHMVRKLRADGLEAYFTLDAGPNVHIITASRFVAELTQRIAQAGYSRAIVDHPGPGAQLMPWHLDDISG